MVRLLLRMKADLENVEAIEFPADYTWNIDVTQAGGTEEKKGVTLSAAEVLEIPGSRGTANLVIRFGGSKHAATINVEHVKGVTRPYTAADSGQFVPIISFECRGVEPTRWTPTTGCAIKGPKSVFEEADIAEDWADFDEAANQSVGVYGLEFDFVVHKN
ncbi:hypothetical protein, conserved [Eimeria tenella]|uniref:Uncharacterized protein n=1 Tax=Eimeria tenella TaxID=5802 RepID=U6L844_EIMTE|nr:hypothetical protein, conserved [Eimeria tenella]CDJ44744.1 hypothetical protein, conserved [Eimeria tenella]|eukprot:XP_013235492.1 hypothetical protein, conserved [Eimeria tenella]